MVKGLGKSVLRFLARKLCTKFVADDPPPGLVERVADTFTKSGGDLTEDLAEMMSWTRLELSCTEFIFTPGEVE